MLPHMPERPAVDVVVPFRGDDASRRSLLATLQSLRLAAGDTLTVVDNGPPGRPPSEQGARSVIVCTDVASSYYARNRGAERGHADWILFLDGDVVPPPNLLDSYFTRPPAETVGVMAGAVLDEPVASSGRVNPAARYAELHAAMGQHNTLDDGQWGYAQTANCAVRRAAFDAVDGFVEDVRSGGDADLCFRIRRLGWEIVARPEAAAVHHSRRTLKAMLRQRARHGSGARWLNETYPGSFPSRLRAGDLLWTLRETPAIIGVLARRADDGAIADGVKVLSHWAFELGRLVPNRVRPEQRAD